MPTIVKNVGKSEDIAAIRAKREGWRQAFEAGDAEGIMAFYAPDDEIVSYDIMPPLEYSGRADYLDSWRKFLSSFDGLASVEFRDLQIKASNDVAFVHCFTRLSGTMNGQPADMWLRETNGLRKLDGEWLLVHDHVSVPMDFESGRALIDLNP